MRILTSRFTIGAFTFKGCHHVSISKGVFQLGDTAQITLPASSVLVTAESVESPKPTASIETARQFKVGDAVTIELGYDGNLNEEFVGFVARINWNVPCSVECEGYSFVLRTKRSITKSYARTTLREVMAEVVKGTGITLHPLMPDLPLRNLVLNNATGIQVIEYVKGLLKGALTSYFIGSELYVGLAYEDLDNQTVKYRLDWNTINSNQLKYHRAIDLDVQVKLSFRNDSGQIIQTTTGKDGGIIRRETLSAISDLKTLQAVAEEKLRRETFDGYEGSITCFGEPFCRPGFRAEIIDGRYQEREGIYFVESTAVSFGTGGFRRTVALGIKLDL